MAAATLMEDRVWQWVLEQQSFSGDDGQGLGEEWMSDDSDETQRLRSHFSVASSVVSEEEEDEAGGEPALAPASVEFGLDDLVREIEDWQAADALQQRAVSTGIELLERAGNEATQWPRALPSARMRWGARGNRGEHDGMMLVEPLLVHGHERDCPAYDPEPRSAALPDRQSFQPFVARRAVSLPTIISSTLAQTSAPPLFFAGPPAEPHPITMANRKYNDTIAPSSYSPPSASSKLRSRSSDMDLRAAFSNSKRPVLLRGPASSESSTTTTSSSTHSARAHFPLLPHMDSISALLRSRASVTVESRASLLNISAPLTAPATPPKPKQQQQHHARSPSGSSVSESSCDSDSVGVLTPNTSYTNIRAVPPQLHGRPAKFNLDRALPPLPPLDASAKRRPASQLPPPRPMNTTPYSPAQSKPSPPPVQRPKRPPLNKRQISLPMSVDVAVAEQILATPPRAAPSPMDYMYPHDDAAPLPQSANPYALEVKHGRRLSDVPAGLVRTLSRSNSNSNLRPTSPPARRTKGAAPPSAFSNPLGALASARASQSSLNLGEATRGLRRVLSFSRPRTTSPEPISPAPVSAPLPPSPPAKDPTPTPDCDWDSDSDFELVTAPRGYFAYSQSHSSASNGSPSPKPKAKSRKQDALLIRAPPRAGEISFEAVRQWATREGEIGRMEAVGRRGVRVVFREPGVCGRWCVRGKGEVYVEGVGTVALEVVQVK